MPDVVDSGGNTDTEDTQDNSSTQSSGCVYDKWGRTPDKSQICAIGIKSASADTQDGVVKCVFENKCAHCGAPALMWGWKWENDQEKVAKFDGTDGTAEGHIYCIQSEGGCDADYSIEGNEHINGSPYKLAVVSGPTASTEEEAQQLSEGKLPCDGSTGVQTDGGGGAQIKDKTFEHCIKRICAATDSVFLVENNAAILFPYTDWMAFVLEAKIQEISASQMDPDIFEIEYNSEGYYNKVVGWWGDVEVPERYIEDETGKIIKNKETIAKPMDTEDETVKKEGNVTTKESNTASGGIQLSKQYDPLIEIYGELEKRVTTPYPDQETAEYALNALLIQYVREFNNKCRVRTLNTKKYIGGTFYIVENPFTKKKTMFYLNGYNIRTQKGEPLYIDLDFRYGPEGAEELLDYQLYSGGSSGSAQSSGPKGDEAAIWTEAAKIHYCHCNSTQDPNEAYQMFHGHEGEDDCSTDCYGMSAYLYYRFNNEANIPCQVVGDSAHHVVMLDRGSGFESTREDYRSYGFETNFKWRENQVETVLLPAPNQSGNNKTVESGGNT